MHSLYVGTTLSGKSYLAKQHAHAMKQAGWDVVVYDPVHQFTNAAETWPADFLTDDRDAFLHAYYKLRNCAIFIDEAGETVGQNDVEMRSLATRGRHYGHRIGFLTQRATMVSPSVRSNCATQYIFRTTVKDGVALADDFAIADAREFGQNVARLGQGDYYRLERMSEPVLITRENTEKKVDNAG